MNQKRYDESLYCSKNFGRQFLKVSRYSNCWPQNEEQYIYFAVNSLHLRELQYELLDSKYFQCLLYFDFSYINVFRSRVLAKSSVRFINISNILLPDIKCSVYVFTWDIFFFLSSLGNCHNKHCKNSNYETIKYFIINVTSASWFPKGLMNSLSIHFFLG